MKQYAARATVDRPSSTSADKCFFNRAMAVTGTVALSSKSHLASQIEECERLLWTTGGGNITEICVALMSMTLVIVVVWSRMSVLLPPGRDRRRTTGCSQRRKSVQGRG